MDGLSFLTGLLAGIVLTTIGIVWLAIKLKDK